MTLDHFIKEWYWIVDQARDVSDPVALKPSYATLANSLEDATIACETVMTEKIQSEALVKELEARVQWWDRRFQESCKRLDEEFGQTLEQRDRAEKAEKTLGQLKTELNEALSRSIPLTLHEMIKLRDFDKLKEDFFKTLHRARDAEAATAVLRRVVEHSCRYLESWGNMEEHEPEAQMLVSFKQALASTEGRTEKSETYGWHPDKMLLEKSLAREAVLRQALKDVVDGVWGCDMAQVAEEALASTDAQAERLLERLKAAEAVMVPAQSLLSVYQRSSDEWGQQLNRALEAWRRAKDGSGK